MTNEITAPEGVIDDNDNGEYHNLRFDKINDYRNCFSIIIIYTDTQQIH